MRAWYVGDAAWFYLLSIYLSLQCNQASNY